MKTLRLSLAILFLVAFSTLGCEESLDRRQTAKQEELSSQADAQTGMPGLTNFTERKIVRKLYELRDQNVATFTYVMDIQGRLWHLCDSLGYGLPYGVQFTNPEKLIYGSGGNTIAQPEPNGLFMPPTAEGTWVICISKRGGDFEPVYSEPRVIVSPFKLKSEGEYIQ